MKKFGLLSYDFPFKRATNIGDYIQSLAAKQFIPNESEITHINREALTVDSDDDFLLIMNGWFSHKVSCWPPSSNISPVFVSFHINESVKEYFKRSETILNYLKRYEPIGCRDTATRDFLIDNGIDAYFSGCLTTTLNRADWTKVDARNGVLFIDIFQGKGSLKHLFKRLDIGFLEKLIRIPRTVLDRIQTYNADKVERKLISALKRGDISYLTTQENTNLTEVERYELAKFYLKKYAEAELVITSRIHVALPCLAFGTPVLFVNPGMDTSRFPGIDEFFNMISIDELRDIDNLSLEKMLLELKNKDVYLKYRESLIHECKVKVEKYSK